MKLLRDVAIVCAFATGGFLLPWACGIDIPKERGMDVLVYFLAVGMSLQFAGLIIAAIRTKRT